MKRYPPAGKGSTVGMGAASIQIGSEPNIARHVAFVIPAVGEAPKPLQSVATEAAFFGNMPRLERSPTAQPLAERPQSADGFWCTGHAGQSTENAFRSRVTGSVA